MVPEAEPKELRRYRERVKREVDDLKARGHGLDVPFEIPDVGDEDA